MNLNISREKGTASLFSGGAFKVKARLNASEEEVQDIVSKSMGTLELVRLPASLGKMTSWDPLYLAELLNRDWEGKFRTEQEAEGAESQIIDACRSLKQRLGEHEETGPKTIEL